MATEVIRTIRASGGDYTTLSAWEAGEQKNLVTADQIAVAECYNDWPTGLVDELDISGWTTDETRYVRVTVAAGHRHTGAPGSGFHIRKASTGSTLVMSRHSYSRLEWIDAVQQSTADTKYCFRAFAQPSVRFYACIAKNQTASTGIGCFSSDSGGAFTALMCLAYGSKIGFTVEKCINCIAANCEVGFGSSTSGTTGAGTSKNCIAYGNTVRGFSTVWNFNSTCSNDASSDTSASWTGCVTGVTSAAFVNAAANNFHLTSGSVLRGAGVNQYSSLTTDIDGDAWPSSGAWDIGYDYYVAAGGVTLNSLTASNITSSGARFTVGLTR